ncbi:MAG TPA: hypothetical protein VJO32_01510 [Ktedonobacteraceae bacterium]|nr:hypothetical protein [Ktedonobacteraceae bacterium]
MMSGRNTDIRVQIYESEYKAIVAEARRLPKIETGGDLYGTFTHGSNPIIWLASGPGPKAHHENAHFEQDTSFTTYWEGRLTREFGLQYIGSWHSHHFIGLQEPSGGDVGAAEVYAQQHNRQTTLEIIVNHQRAGIRQGEQEFTTTLRPYFYPNAQRARMERFVLASFVPLSGISPIRQQLGSDVLSQFNVISWKKAASIQFPAAQVSQNPASQMVGDDDAVVIPDILGRELQDIAGDVQDFDIQQKSGVFLVSITLRNACILALALQKSPNLRITQVNLIDQSRDINENISTKLHDERLIHFSINQSNRGVLRRLVREVPSIHGEVVRIAEEKRHRAIQRQDEQPVPDRSRGLLTQQRNEELLEAQRQVQKQRVQELDEQLRAAQSDLNSLRIESQSQLNKQESEIEQLKAELDAAKQRLTAYAENMRVLMEASNQRSEQQQQLDDLRSSVIDYENRLLEAQKELANRQQLGVQLNEAQRQIEAQQHNAEVLERRLGDFQARLAAHEQLEAQLNKAQQQLEAQQCEVSELQVELNNARSQLQVFKEKADRRRLLSIRIPGRNRDGPVNPAGKEKDALMTIVIIATLIVIVVVAIVLIVILGHRHLLSMWSS